jgi:hypothetical protein
MSENTIEGLRSRIEAARARERSARAAAARLQREMAATNRRLETQRLCVLGRAWAAYAADNPGQTAAMQIFLENYISRATDRAALVGTRWALPEAVAQGGDDR